MDIPCTYFIFPITSFIAKFTYEIRVITIMCKNHFHGFRSKSWVKFPQFMLCPILILHVQLGISGFHRDLSPINPFLLIIDGIGKTFVSTQCGTRSLQISSTQIRFLLCYIYNILIRILLKLFILKKIWIINKGITDYVIHIYFNLQEKITVNYFLLLLLGRSPCPHGMFIVGTRRTAKKKKKKVVYGNF